MYNHENVDVHNDIITHDPSSMCRSRKSRHKETQKINTANRTTNTRLDVEGVLGRGVAVLESRIKCFPLVV